LQSAANKYKSNKIGVGAVELYNKSKKMKKMTKRDMDQIEVSIYGAVSKYKK
tara:strand:- start:316 stop:471 length:156 start_codon:yes stop_codon:yes gene_type:complete